MGHAIAGANAEGANAKGANAKEANEKTKRHVRIHVPICPREGGSLDHAEC